MKAHLLLMENAKHGDHDVNTMEAKIAEVVSGAINATQGKMMAAEEGYDITFAKRPHANSVQ
jgi:hypothetical protein